MCIATMAQPVFTPVDALRPDTTGHNLTVQVLDAKTVVDRPARAGARPQKIMECLVGDESGVILFNARNAQGNLMKAGAYITLLNAKVEMFRGSMRLAVGNAGKVEAAEGVSFKPKTDYNLSLVEYELVPVPDVFPEEAAAAAAAAAPKAAAEEEESAENGGDAEEGEEEGSDQ